MKHDDCMEVIKGERKGQSFFSGGIPTHTKSSKSSLKSVWQ